MLNQFQAAFLPHGQLPRIETVEQDLTSVIWNRLDLQVIGSHSLISGAARDSGHTGFTDVIRPGLLLTKDAEGKFTTWGDVTDFATDKIEGIMLIAQRMTRAGNNQDRWLGYILLGGCIKSNGIIVPGETTAGILGHAQETNIRTQLKLGFRFDDDPLGHLAS